MNARAIVVAACVRACVLERAHVWAGLHRCGGGCARKRARMCLSLHSRAVVWVCGRWLWLRDGYLFVLTLGISVRVTFGPGHINEGAYVP